MKTKNFVQNRSAILNLFLYIILGLSAILLPIILPALKLPIVSNTYGDSYEKFELLGFSMSVALIAVAYFELEKRSKAPFKQLLPIIVPILVSFNFLSIITEYSEKLYDYKCYEIAAKAILEGRTPYNPANIFLYTYPPLPAQVLALVYQLLERSVSLQHSITINMQEEIWSKVFYFYQCSQFLLLILAYFLGYRFARNLGLKSVPTLILISAILLLNNPIIRTLKHGQINLWILDSFLGAVLLLQHYPLLSGLPVALGVHIKLYPLILLFPWIITKQWRAVVGSLLAFFGIMLIQTDLGRNWTLWHQFLAFFGGDGAAAYVPDQFRNNSLHSLIYNSFQIIGIKKELAKVVFVLVTLAVVVWFVSRFIKREKAYFALMKTADIQSNSRWENTFRLYSHSIDALALGMLISPSVWEHHYVLAIPIAIWAVGIRTYDKLWQVGIGIFLMFCIPTFDIFPVSSCRVLGLLILIYLTSPQMFRNRISQLQNEKESISVSS